MRVIQLINGFTNLTHSI